MSKRPRQNHIPAFEAKVALAAVKGEKTLVELAQQYRRASGRSVYLVCVSASDIQSFGLCDRLRWRELRQNVVLMRHPKRQLSSKAASRLLAIRPVFALNGGIDRQKRVAHPPVKVRMSLS